MPAVKLTNLDEGTFAFDHRAEKSFRSMVKRSPAGLRPAGHPWTESANLSVTQLSNARIKTLTERRLNQTEVSVFSPIQDAHLLCFRIQKDQELFLGKFHLQNGFLR